MTVADDILKLLERRPGLTESQISSELYGTSFQKRVNSSCRRLVRQGLVKRRGKGGFKDPFTYYEPARAK